MYKPNLYRPPPPPPLADLTDDDEAWATAGTRIIPKPPQPPQPVAPTMMSTVNQSFYPVAMSAPPPRKQSNVAIWVALAGFVVLVLGVGAAAAGFVIYRMHQSSEEATLATATTIETAAPEPTETQAPIALPTAVTSASVASSATAPKPPIVAAPTTATTGTLRTFAIATGRPVVIDGHQVGVGGRCGRHVVGVGAGKAKTLDIPCGGVLTVGTPDGT